ncbi:MAG: hypothetical protein OWS74_04345 [Firmicutes bacterium]|nr:hypothetical protein [Bacillota bacterium]
MEYQQEDCPIAIYQRMMEMMNLNIKASEEEDQRILSSYQAKAALLLEEMEAIEREGRVI